MNKSNYIILKDNILKLSLPRSFFSVTKLDFLILQILAFTIYINSNLFYLFVSPLLSILLFRSFCLMHEASHGLISSSKNKNDFVGLIYGSICCLPFLAWKKGHLEHHYWTGNIEKDPVMAILIKYPGFQNWFKSTISFLWKCWLPIIAVMQQMVFWILAIGNIKHQRNVAFVANTLFPVLFWTMAFIGLPAEFLVYCLAPALFIYFTMIEVVNLPHHLQLQFNRGSERKNPWEQYSFARSCIYPKWIEENIVLNFNYHTEHHMLPHLRWYDLPKARKEIKNAIQTNYNEDISFRWIIENKKLHLDDVLVTEDKNMMQKISEEAS